MAEDMWGHYRAIKESTDPDTTRKEIGLFLDFLDEVRKANPELDEIKRRAVVKVAWIIAKRIWRPEVKGVELRELMRLGYRVFVNVMKGWPQDPKLEPRRFFMTGLAHRLSALEKGDGANRVPIPCEVAKGYLILAEKLLGFLAGDDFRRRPAPAETVELTKGKVKDFPSNLEQAIAFAHRCYRQYASGATPLKPSEAMLDYLKAHIGGGKWFGLYYGTWLVYVGRPIDARDYLADMTAANFGESWAWRGFAESFAGDAANCKRCLAKALLCPVHDETVSNGIAKKVHRALAAALRREGDEANARAEEALAASADPLPGNAEFYRALAAGAGRRVCDGRKRLWVEGTVMRRPGQAIAFIRAAGGVSCFVPPKLVDRNRLEDGMEVKGIAERSFDRKKNREGWAMARIVRD